MKNLLKKAIKDFYGSESLEAMSDPASLTILRENNMVFPDEKIGHDELVLNLIQELALVKKHNVVESFLVGLEKNQPEKRAALSAYAIALNFPKHSFQSIEGTCCDICRAFRNEDRDFTLCNLGRYTVGASRGSAEDIYFSLRMHNETRFDCVNSIDVFKNVLSLLREASSNDTPLIIEKKIRAVPGLKMDKEQSRGLLDLLGHIGVLETPEHKGFIHEYKNIGLMPRKSRSSDWSYPVDFWKGEYGVNEEAVEFWFGDYLRKFK